MDQSAGKDWLIKAVNRQYGPAHAVMFLQRALCLPAAAEQHEQAPQRGIPRLGQSFALVRLRPKRPAERPGDLRRPGIGSCPILVQAEFLRPILAMAWRQIPCVLYRVI